MEHQAALTLARRSSTDARLFSLVTELLAKPLQSLATNTLFDHRVQVQADGLRYARVVKTEPDAVVIEFASEAQTRNSSAAFRLRCVFTSEKANLVPAWLTGYRLRRACGTVIQNRVGKQALDRRLGECLAALQEAKNFGPFQEQPGTSTI